MVFSKTKIEPGLRVCRLAVDQEFQFAFGKIVLLFFKKAFSFLQGVIGASFGVAGLGGASLGRQVEGKAGQQEHCRAVRDSSFHGASMQDAGAKSPVNFKSFRHE